MLYIIYEHQEKVLGVLWPMCVMVLACVMVLWTCTLGLKSTQSLGESRWSQWLLNRRELIFWSRHRIDLWSWPEASKRMIGHQGCLDNWIIFLRPIDRHAPSLQVVAYRLVWGWHEEWIKWWQLNCDSICYVPNANIWSNKDSLL